MQGIRCFQLKSSLYCYSNYCEYYANEFWSVTVDHSHSVNNGVGYRIISGSILSTITIPFFHIPLMPDTSSITTITVGNTVCLGVLFDFSIEILVPVRESAFHIYIEMSIRSEEVNYLIYRYLQESGRSCF